MIGNSLNKKKLFLLTGKRKNVVFWEDKGKLDHQLTYPPPFQINNTLFIFLLFKMKIKFVQYLRQYPKGESYYM